ncbi:hypothetical protein EPO56_02575 [Patescibacteria group bacterium]|nr:MAG: hypothetical protein EPO56_02575 [Patescibacteria group bacterium]
MKHILRPIIALIALSIALGVFILVTYRIASFTDTAREAYDKTTILDARKANAKGTEALVKDVIEDKATLGEFVVKDSEQVRLIEAVEGAARKENLKTNIGSIVVLANDWKYHDRVRVTVSTRGSFASLISFGRMLESLPEASWVESASFEVSANNTWFAVYIVDFVKEKPTTL